MINKHAQIMRAYGWTHDHVMFDLTSAQGWVWFNEAVESEASAFGVSTKRKSAGYVAAERESIINAKGKSAKRQG